ncbi:MAG: chorismate synthase, partial [Leptotrichiaceae bacterium]|nr:chorismate synthase [Leptotrichiaceae bacterium]
MGANFGKNYCISIFGESHGAALGVNIDGIPAGTELDLKFISEEMRRRAPGKSELSTPRAEKDEFEILSGYVNGKTTGSPLAMIIRNMDQRSKDYSEIARKPRPGHADWSGMNRYDGFNDIRGSGHFSGRITASLVFAGAIGKQILKEKGILIAAHIKSVKDIKDRDFREEDISAENVEKLRNMLLPVLNGEIISKIQETILKAKEEGDSVGGTVEVMITGLKAGIGDPFFESMESELARMMFSIPAIKGLEFGAGFSITEMTGYEANDEMYYDEKGNVKSYTNNNGGITGGIT